MQRRELLKRSAALGALAALPFPLSAAHPWAHETPEPARPLPRPAPGTTLPVAFLLSDDAVVIDFAGPWAVFDQVMNDTPFKLYTVAETADPITVEGGMKIVPDYTFATAPAPKVIVIPAQKDPTDAVLQWVRQASKTADLTMSVCTGALLLAKTGLLAGRAATTHHGALTELAAQYPDITVKRGVRYVEDGAFATSGGLSCGIDLALRVVERYYDRATAEEAAYNLEYLGRGWTDPALNAMYGKPKTARNGKTVCVVCGMYVDRTTAPHSEYKGTTYYFCGMDHKQIFDRAPEKALT